MFWIRLFFELCTLTEHLKLRLKALNRILHRQHTQQTVILVMSAPRMKQLALFSREPWCFPRRGQGKHQDSKENKTHWFPEGPDIKFFVIFLDFHFNSNKRITGANQNSPVGTYNNTNLILKTAEWMIYASVNSSCAGHLPTPGLFPSFWHAHGLLSEYNYTEDITGKKAD